MSEHRDYSSLDCETLIQMAIDRDLIDEAETGSSATRISIGSLDLTIDSDAACVFVRGLLRGYERVKGEL